MTEKTKGKIIGALSGLLIGALVTGGVASYAAGTVGTLKNVRIGGVKIVVDGQELHPTDANGNAVEPFIYNGTTYLPVRAIANATGKAVYWDGPEYTVYLGDMDGKLEYPTATLFDLTSISNTPEYSNKLTDNYGNRYSTAAYASNGNAEYRYLTNMKYSRFKGTLYVPNGVKVDGNSVIFTITADGKTIYTSPNITKATFPIDIDINIAGYNDIKLNFRDTSNYSTMEICLGDAGFYQ